MKRWLLCIRCLAPMQHNKGTTRNKSNVNRIAMAGEDGRVNQVPIISANSLRHNCIREPLGLDLIDRYGLEGTLDKQQLRLLVSGGNNASEKGGRIDIKTEMEIRQALPMLSLLGCGLPSGPIPSRLKFSDAVLVCKESIDNLRMIAPELELQSNAWSHVRLVADADHYAPDPSHKLGHFLTDAEQAEGYDDNIFGGEYVIPGAVFIAELIAERLTEAEESAIAFGLRMWVERGGYLGGKSAQGSGRTECILFGSISDDEPYIKHSDEQQKQAESWLTKIYEKKKTIKKKTSGSSKSQQRSLL